MNGSMKTRLKKRRTWAAIVAVVVLATGAAPGVAPAAVEIVCALVECE